MGLWEAADGPNTKLSTFRYPSIRTEAAYSDISFMGSGTRRYHILIFSPLTRTFAGLCLLSGQAMSPCFRMRPAHLKERPSSRPSPQLIKVIRKFAVMWVENGWGE